MRKKTKSVIWPPKRIKGLREALGDTQEEFARRLGVSWVTVSRWETGAGKPSKLGIMQLERIDQS